MASQRRKQIVEAARACISEEGLEKLTLRKVAEKAQISHATIAYYFQTRKNLIDAALLETSEEFMGVLRQKELVYGPEDLTELVETFLDAKNPAPRFVVQMIDAGLHDLQLRGTHNEFVEYGRDRIEQSIRVGIEQGHYRADIDPKLAAALVHTLLIWWEAELAADATSQTLALDVGRLALRLLEQQPAEANIPSNGGSGRSAKSNGGVSLDKDTASPVELVQASLRNDPNLSTHAATTLGETFEKLYELAFGVSGIERKSEPAP